MTLLAWTLMMTVVATGALLAALSTRADRRRAGRWTMIAATGGLFLLLGSDVVAVGWILMAVMVGAADSRHQASAHVSPWSPGGRVVAGVLVAGLLAALYLLAIRVDWQGLPAGSFQANTAELATRLVSGDLLALLGLALAWVVAAMGRRAAAPAERRNAP
jgi:hypothetical protein